MKRSPLQRRAPAVRIHLFSTSSWARCGRRIDHGGGRPNATSDPLKATCRECAARAKGDTKKARQPVKRVSRKRAAANRERRKVVETLARDVDHCQAGERIIRFADPHHVCDVVLHDPHERLSRGRGGSITDPANILLVCRSCHRWIGAHDREAVELELSEHSWGT